MVWFPRFRCTTPGNVRIPPIADNEPHCQSGGVTRLDPDSERWLPELRKVLGSIAIALGGRGPNPALIMGLRSEYEDAVTDHKVEIEYFPGGYTDDPERLPEYAVSLTGRRFLASWLLLESDLHGFIRSDRA